MKCGHDPADIYVNPQGKKTYCRACKRAREAISREISRKKRLENKRKARGGTT
jgi:hypothetical protein